MPKLPPHVREEVENADDSGGVKAAPEGHFLVTMTEAEEKPAKGQGGYDMLLVKLKVLQPRHSKGHVFWRRFSYNPNSAWRLKQLFDAFDYDYNSDTDEIVESDDTIVVYNEPEVIGEGSRKGELGDNLTGFMFPDDEAMALVED